MMDQIITAADADGDGQVDVLLQENYLDTDGDGNLDTYVVQADTDGDQVFDESAAYYFDPTTGEISPMQ